jgi:hypothetical protein
MFSRSDSEALFHKCFDLITRQEIGDFTAKYYTLHNEAVAYHRSLSLPASDAEVKEMTRLYGLARPFQHWPILQNKIDAESAGEARKYLFFRSKRPVSPVFPFNTARQFQQVTSLKMLQRRQTDKFQHRFVGEAELTSGQYADLGAFAFKLGLLLKGR